MRHHVQPSLHAAITPYLPQHRPKIVLLTVTEWGTTPPSFEGSELETFCSNRHCQLGSYWRVFY